MTEITQAVVRELVSYDRETGVFTWLARDRKWFTRVNQFKIWNGRFAGRPITRTGDCGYILVSLNGTQLKAHRLAWFYEYGVWPSGEIDHINHDRSDNRIINLRDVPRTENAKNKSVHSHNTSGTTGVGRTRGKWVAYIGTNGRHINLGVFADKESAVVARRNAEAEHGFHANHGMVA